MPVVYPVVSSLRAFYLHTLQLLHYVGGDGSVAHANTSSIPSSSGIYNSSETPSGLPWTTYNYCNAPHVNGRHYFKPEGVEDAQLVYLNVVMRHHKRTPDNLLPAENSLNSAAGWDCSDFIQMLYGGGTTQIHRETVIPSWHPFLRNIWNGTCDVGQLTRAGLDDAVRHGQDFWSVYHHQLGFLETISQQDVYIRTSTELRTFQVAGALLFGMDPTTSRKGFAAHAQPGNIDSIVPSYPCPKADSIRDAYQSVPAWTDHLDANRDLQSRLEETLGTGGMPSWSSWYDHYFDVFSSRMCHGHPLPCNSTGACISEDDALKVFALGDYEYNYIWNAAQNSTTYVSLTFGVFFLELARNFKLYQAGGESYKMRFYVGHDGSMIRLAAGLGLGRTGLGSGRLRWPALGSEIVLEVWQTNDKARFVRVVHEGRPVEAMKWIPLGDFISLLETNIPDRIYETCMGV